MNVQAILFGTFLRVSCHIFVTLIYKFRNAKKRRLRIYYELKVSWCLLGNCLYYQTPVSSCKSEVCWAIFKPYIRIYSSCLLQKLILTLLEMKPVLRQVFDEINEYLKKATILIWIFAGSISDMVHKELLVPKF